MALVVGPDPVDGVSLRRQEPLVEGAHGATMGRDRAAAVGRNPVLAPQRRAYHDRPLVRYPRASPDIGGRVGEEGARGEVEAGLHAVLDLLGHVAKAFEGGVEVENGYLRAAYLLGGIEA